MRAKTASIVLILVLTFMFITSLISLDQGVSQVVADSDQYDPVVEIRHSKFDLEANLIVTGHTENGDVYIGKVSRQGLILWENVMGGSDLDLTDSFIIDSKNNIFIIGVTQSNDFDTLSGFQSSFGGDSDLFITKINQDGQIEWGSYIGGEGLEYFPSFINTIFLDSSENVIVIGGSNSSHMILQGGFHLDNRGGEYNDEGTYPGDLIVAKFSNDGDLIFQTFMGGSQGEFGYPTIDQDDNIVIFGVTNSPDIGYLEGQYAGNVDHFLVKINPFGELLWGRYLGGSSLEVPYNVLIDSGNDIIIQGHSYSSDYSPIVNNLSPFNNEPNRNDLIIGKFNENGEEQWVTYFGGDQNDHTGCCNADQDDAERFNAEQIFLDSQNNVILMGSGDSFNFPTQNAFRDAAPISAAGKMPYLVKFNFDGSLNFSTYLTSGSGNFVIDLELVENDGIVIIGNTGSDDYPIENAFQSDYGGLLDGTFAYLSASGEVITSSYLGGSSRDEIKKAVLTLDGKIFLAGITQSENLPQAINSHHGDVDIFICLVDITVEWCKYIGGEGLETLNRFSVQAQNSGEILIIGTTSSSDFDGTDVLFNEAGFIQQYNTNGDLTWEVLLTPESRTFNANRDIGRTLRILATVAIISGISFFTIEFWRKNRQIDDILLNENMERILSPIFNNHPSIIHLFAGTKIIKDKQLVEDTSKVFPVEIFDFKYFMHPVRLSIIKLLDENINITTVELKETLGLGWKEITNHLDSLRKNGHVEIEQKFVDNNIKSVVNVDPNTIAQYQSLKEIMIQFFDASPNIDKYLEHASEVKRRSDDANLYPDNGTS